MQQCSVIALTAVSVATFLVGCGGGGGGPQQGPTPTPSPTPTATTSPSPTPSPAVTPTPSPTPSPTPTPSPSPTPTATPSPGTLAFYESFNYPAGSTLAGQSGAYGGSGSWRENTAQGSSPSTIVAGGLTYGSLVTSGNSMEFTSDYPVGEDYDLATPIGPGSPLGNVAYVSVLVRPIDSFTAGYPDTYFTVGIDDMFIGKTGSSNYWGIWYGPGNLPLSLSNKTAQRGVTTLLVIRFTFLAGPDKIELWVNPPLGQPLPATPDAVKSDMDIGSLASIHFGGSIRCQWDEVRIGTSWSSVSPAQ